VDSDHPRPLRDVLCAGDVPGLEQALRRLGLAPCRVAAGEPIPGSFWGEPEAGLIGACLYLRDDTPVHSALHEACHFVCMDPARRGTLHTDAGGDFAEEDAVCLLQILLAGTIDGVGSPRMCTDMDAWGYTFRLGSASAWWRNDSDDAHGWLLRHGLVDAAGKPTGALRQ
jgi:hypothetical protein